MKNENQNSGEQFTEKDVSLLVKQYGKPVDPQKKEKLLNQLSQEREPFKQVQRSKQKAQSHSLKRGQSR